jgi:hypothetical protein
MHVRVADARPAGVGIVFRPGERELEIAVEVIPFETVVVPSMTQGAAGVIYGSI